MTLTELVFGEHGLVSERCDGNKPLIIKPLIIVPIGNPTQILVEGNERDPEYFSRLRQTIEDYASLHRKNANAYARDCLSTNTTGDRFVNVDGKSRLEEVRASAIAFQFYRISK